MNFPAPPLSPEAIALCDAILAIPRTSEPFNDYPDGLNADRIESLYYASQDGDPKVIPELKRLIARFPEYPTFRNFLRVAHVIRGNHRQADAVIREMAKQHPDYLYSRLGQAEEVLNNQRPPELVLQHLGHDLDLARLYPERSVFHVAEIRGFYHLVGAYHARCGRPDLTRGVMAALEIIEPDSPVFENLDRELMMANRKRNQEITHRDARIHRSVVTPKPSRTPTGAAPPTYNHPEVERLGRTPFTITADELRALLALPRESLVADLILMLEDAILRTPDIMEADSDDESCGPLHAIHLLAELDATEAADALIRFLSLDEDATQFWLGDYSYDHLHARILADSVSRITAILKAPAIHSYSKSMLSSSLAKLADFNPARRGEVVDALAPVLRHMLEASPEDNVIDTAAISFIICDCLDLRAVELEPLIEQLWERELIEQMVCGDLDMIRISLRKPQPPAVPQLDIFQSYHSYQSRSGLATYQDDDDVVDDPIDIGRPVSGSSLYDLPFSSTPEPGRNDPCPCGSGRKYKKCCMP